MTTHAGSSDATPELTDQVVVVRPWRTDDAPALYATIHESRTHLSRFLAWPAQHRGVADCDTWISLSAQRRKSYTDFEYGIFDAKSQLCLGGVGLGRIDAVNRVANLGYWRRVTAAHRGIVTRSTRLVARHAFTQGPFERIEILAAVENTASHSVARKLGAKFEGIARNRLWVRERSLDAHVYSLIRGDFRSGSAVP